MSPLSTPMRLRLQDEAVFGRLPLLLGERAYGFAALLRAGARLALAAWGFLLGGYTAGWLGAVPGLLTLMAGSLAGLTAAAACSLACNRYGIDPIDAVKGCFGQRGAKALIPLFVVNQVGWTGLLLVMFGRGVQSVLASVGVVRGDGIVTLMTLVGALTVYVMVARGARHLSFIKTLTVPSLAVLACIVLYSVLRDVAWIDLARIPPLTPASDTRLSLVMAFECALGAGFSWWPTLGRLTRSADAQRTSFYAPLLAIGLGTAAVAGGGHLAALLFRNYDPTQWLVFLGGRAFGALTLLVVAAANLHLGASMMRASTAALRHFSGLRRLRWPFLTALAFAGLLPVLSAPTLLYERGAAFISLNATFLGPVSAVFCIDYFILRRQVLNLSQIFEDDRRGLYWFSGGFNPVAFACAGLGQAVALALYNPISGATSTAVRTLGATGPAIGIAALAYLALGKLVAAFAGAGGYDARRHALPLGRPNI